MTAPSLQRHRLDTAALLFGIVFLVEGLAALAQQVHWVHLHGRTWFGVVVVAAGLAGAGAVVANAVRLAVGSGSGRREPLLQVGDDVADRLEPH
jgi:hypothetical protein